MPFNEIVTPAKPAKRQPLIQEVRVQIKKRGDADGLSAYLRIPPKLIEELNWSENDRFDVLKGDGEDEGWYAMRVNSDAKRGAHLKFTNSGVATLYTNRLVPEDVKEPSKIWTPPIKINDGMLLIKMVQD